MVNRALPAVYLAVVLLAVVGRAEEMQNIREARLTKALTFYVAPAGRDSWSGKLPSPNSTRSDGPFATLEAARDAIRRLRRSGLEFAGGVIVQVRGTFVRDKAFELTAEDSGSSTAPVVYRGLSPRESRLWGGREISGFKRVTEAAVLNRLSAEARGHVLQVDLKAQGISDYGIIRSRGHGSDAELPAALELFFRGRPLQLARWPNSTPWPNEGYELTHAPIAADRFTYSGDRPSRWATTKNVWLGGYWQTDWAYNTVPVASIDTQKKEIISGPTHGVYGYKEGGRYFFLNVLEELDSPGEYYVDREKGILYLWPPRTLPAGPRSGVVASSLEASLIKLTNVENVTFERLGLEYCRGAAVRIDGGRNNKIAGCTPPVRKPDGRCLRFTMMVVEINSRPRQSGSGIRNFMARSISSVM